MKGPGYHVYARNPIDVGSAHSTQVPNTFELDEVDTTSLCSTSSVARCAMRPPCHWAGEGRMRSGNIF